MKKILIATTALVATAGVAAADVSLSGSARMGLQYNDNPTNVEDLTLHTRVRIRIQATGETDGGLTWGAKTRIQAANGSTGTAINSSAVWIGGSWGKLTVGDTDPAGDDFGITSWGFANVGGGEAAEASRYTGGSNVRYDGSFGDLTVVATLGLSYSNAGDPIDGDYSLGFGYNFGNFAVNLAFDHDELHAATAAENDSVAARISGSFGDVAVGLFVADSDSYGSGWGIDAAYTMGNLTIGANYSEIDDDNALIAGAGDNDSYEIGFKYGLGGGATLAGAVGQNSAGDTVADLGISLKF